MPDEELVMIQRLVQEIENLKLGLDHVVLAGWYGKIESDAKREAPGHLRESIQVVQDPILPMKFEFRTSKRAVGCVQHAIEDNLASMPFATRLYFEKLSELIEHQVNYSP